MRRVVVGVFLGLFFVPVFSEDADLTEYNPYKGISADDMAGYVQDRGGNLLNESLKDDPNITQEEYDIILQFKEYGHIQRAPALPVVSRKDGKPVAVKQLPIQQGAPPKKRGMSFSDMAEHIKKKEQ